MGRTASAGDDDSMPRLRRAAYSNSRSGVRCAETTSSRRESELVSASAAARIVSPVGSRAHDDANQWFHHEILSNKVRIERNSSRDALPAARIDAFARGLGDERLQRLAIGIGTPFEQVIERLRLR
jgi:hypothetical protein